MHCNLKPALFNYDAMLSLKSLNLSIAVFSGGSKGEGKARGHAPPPLISRDFFSKIRFLMSFQIFSDSIIDLSNIFSSIVSQLI